MRSFTSGRLTLASLSPGLRSRICKFLIVGGVSTLIQLLITRFLLGLSVELLMASSCGVGISLITSYFGNRTFAWSDRVPRFSSSKVNVVMSIALFFPYLLGMVPVLGVISGGQKFFTELLGFPFLLSWAISTGMGMFVNFLASDKWAFGLMCQVANKLKPFPTQLNKQEKKGLWMFFSSAKTVPFEELFTFMTAVFKTARPKQWAKNILFCSIAIAFSIFDLSSWVKIMITVVAFCFVSSSVYFLNDLHDAEADRQHPKKRERPIASGIISPYWAVLISTILALAGILTSLILLPITTTTIIAIYLALSFGYTFLFKQIPYVEFIPMGIMFGLRALSGFTSTAVFPNGFEFIIFSAVMVAASITVAKRISEMKKVKNSSQTRKNLATYTFTKLSAIFYACFVSAIVAFIAFSFTFFPLMGALFAFPWIGLRKFWNLMHNGDCDVQPTEVITNSPHIVTSMVMTLVLFVFLLFVKHLRVDL